MSDNSRLARELFGWELDDHARWESYEGMIGPNCRCTRVQVNKGDWHPDINDRQAQMVVEAVAMRGFSWEIRTFTHSRSPGQLIYDVLLYDIVGKRVYGKRRISDRNLHICNAAIAALDAEKPEPHRCKDMPEGSEWGQRDGTWELRGKLREYMVAISHPQSTHCSFCGHDLNKPDEGGLR